MKTAVVIGLLVLGTGLILAPFLFDYLNPVSAAMYPQELERHRIRDYRLTYAAVTWVAGFGMVGVGVFAAFWWNRGQTNSTPNSSDRPPVSDTSFRC